MNCPGRLPHGGLAPRTERSPSRGAGRAPPLGECPRSLSLGSPADCVSAVGADSFPNLMAGEINHQVNNLGVFWKEAGTFPGLFTLRNGQQCVPRLAIQAARPVLLSPESRGATGGLGRPTAVPSNTEEPTAWAVTPSIYWPFETTDGLTTKSEASRQRWCSPTGSCRPEEICVGWSPTFGAETSGWGWGREVCERLPQLREHSRVGAGCSMGISPWPRPLRAQVSPITAHCSADGVF